MENAEKYTKECPHKELCGGCMYQGRSYEEQLRTKEEQVDGSLRERKIVPREREPIEGSPSQWHYRNKMEYTFGDMVKDGPMTLGMHQRGKFMSIITVDRCMLVHEDFNIILKAVLEFSKEKGYSKYNKKSHKGLMRHLVLRRGIRTGDILVNIVTASDHSSGEFFDEKAFVEMIRSLELENHVTGILRTINDGLADAVNCDELKVLWGDDHYTEEIAGLKFKVGPFSFFQTNVEAAERLYLQALDLIDGYDDKRVWDLFCGTGTITQILARKAKYVTGVELVEEAVEAAEENARLNGLDNCRFIAGDVFKVLPDIGEKPDVIVVDPPRMGIQEKAMDLIIEQGVDQILYISCNPKTLVANLDYFTHHGYRVESLKAYDNFPCTKHVEAVCLLSGAGRTE